MDVSKTKVLLIIFAFLAYGFKITLCYHSFEFFFINTPMTWRDAKAYCRENHDSMATVMDMEDNDLLSAFPGEGWIGIHDTPENWRDGSAWWWWSFNGTHGGAYQNWTLNKPDNVNATERCVIMWNGQWDDASCDDSLPFVCFTGSSLPGSRNFTFVSENMTWDQARIYCIDHYTNLAMIKNTEENAAVASVIPPSMTQRVWIGLSRSSWWWDGPGSYFSNWAFGEPNNDNNREHCALMDADGLWKDVDCYLEHPFFCQQAFKTMQRHIKLPLQSSANLSDPAVYNQIMQQIGEKIALQGYTDFKVIWKRKKV